MRGSPRWMYSYYESGESAVQYSDRVTCRQDLSVDVTTLDISATGTLFKMLNKYYDSAETLGTPKERTSQ